MYVITRNNDKEPLKFDKITGRIEKLCYGLNRDYVDPTVITQKIANEIFDGITTGELDNLAAQTAADLVMRHPDYSLLAGRIAVDNLHKETKGCFSENIKMLYSYVNPKNNTHSPLVSKELHDVVVEHAELLDKTIVDDRDFSYDYFGLKTLERSYLLKMNGKIVERPGQMLLRVALGIHLNNIEEAIETYELMSKKLFTHATPTLFNSGTERPQLSSCFLLTMQDDSIDGIYKTLSQTALISQSAGGIGLSIHNIRGKGSYIRGTNGQSNGIVPMLKVFNDTARYVDQGGGKRKGSFSIYLEPWHSDIEDFLELKKNTGKDEVRARDLFYALWVPDLFMKRVENNEMWSLMCPNECPGLHDTYGKGFEELYTKYEKEGKFIKQVNARELWTHVISCQIETGQPSILYKDACNRKSNQKNLGTIRSSNLCTEIIEYTSPDEVAVCNLASVALPMFVKMNLKGEYYYDHKELHRVVKKMARNLDRIIDINHYPVEEARNSNFRHRPIGIGVQGLADTFMKMKIPFESSDALKLNTEIFETIYHAAVSTSIEIAKEKGSYSSFKDSPSDKGQLQFDLWGAVEHSGRYDWNLVKEELKEHGMRNSLLVAPMPTASTSQILGNNECFEPITSNLYTRRVLSGEFVITNKYLVNDLEKLGLWNDEMKNALVKSNGSIQNIEGIPDDIKAIYKTVWEIKVKHMIDMAAARGPYICQSQSMNIYMQNPDIAKVNQLHFYAWKKGLKTGLYYLRSRAAVNAIQFTVKADSKAARPIENNEDDDCLMCGA